MPAATALHDVAPATLKAWLERDEAILVDVREADEYARERIAGARLHPLSSLAPAALPRGPGKKLVLQCNSGSRTRQAAAAILAREPMELYHLAGGIQAWKRDGLPVEADRRAPLPIMRQVQIAAGSLVLLGLLLALLLSPWLALLSAFVGAGLVFAGITGQCGMAKLLERLPYNRPAPRAARV
jgi:rhodanese-related sulfurtransferase